MVQPTLIVVHGAPASGKTDLSLFLAQALGLPLLSKDEIKETLFEHFDHHSIAYSDRIDAASLDLLWRWLDTCMRGARGSLLVETAFPDVISQPRLANLLTSHDFAVVQIYCHATEPVLRQRYVERAGTPHRHPGHQDLARVEGQPIPESGSYFPLDLPGPLIDVDTTVMESVDHALIRQTVAALIASS